jgi:hypothetical protein
LREIKIQYLTPILFEMYNLTKKIKSHTQVYNNIRTAQILIFNFFDNYAIIIYNTLTLGQK